MGSLYAKNPLDGYPILLSSHSPFVVVGKSMVIANPKELYSNIDWHAGTGAIFVLNVFTAAPEWDSQIDHMVGVPWEGKPFIIDEAGKKDLRYQRRMFANMNYRILHDYGTDPVRLLADRAKEKDVTFFVKFRMNDHHKMYRHMRNSYHHGYFWLENPQFADNQDRFDYAHPEVRNYYLDLMEEVLKLHPTIEGFEMDFLRSPLFFKGDAKSQSHFMDDFMREARKRIDSINKKENRNIVLGACVPLTVEASLDAGLDLKVWAKEKLVDYLVPKRWQTEGCETFPNLDQFRKEVGGKVKIFGHYNDYNDVPKLEEASAMAALLDQEGADGLHLFNVWNDAIGLNNDPTKKERLLKRMALLKQDAHYGQNKFYNFGKKDIKFGHKGNSPFPCEFSAENDLVFELTTGEDYKKAFPHSVYLGVRVPQDQELDFNILFNKKKLKVTEVVPNDLSNYGDVPKRLYPDPLNKDGNTGWNEIRYELNPKWIKNGIRKNKIHIQFNETTYIRGMYLEITYK